MIAAVVLAAGRATRFGATKQLALLEGRPLVRHAVDVAVAAGLAPVLVVVGHDAEEVRAVLPEEAVVVDNPRFARGQATSLRAGVGAADRAGAEALVVLLADQPRVGVDAVRAVVSAYRAGASVARVRYRDRPGHPVLFSRHTWPRLMEVTGDVGARGLLGELEVVEVPVDADAPDDVDIPADLP